MSTVLVLPAQNQVPKGPHTAEDVRQGTSQVHGRFSVASKLRSRGRRILQPEHFYRYVVWASNFLTSITLTRTAIDLCRVVRRRLHVRIR